MMMRMRGGSTIFAKYCQKGISRQYSSSSSSNNNRVREFKTVEELSQALPGLVGRGIVYTIETLAFKLGIFYVGYQLAVFDSPYHPEKYAPEMKDLLAQRDELLEKKKKKKEALLAQKMDISNRVQ